MKLTETNWIEENRITLTFATDRRNPPVSPSSHPPYHRKSLKPTSRVKRSDNLARYPLPSYAAGTDPARVTAFHAVGRVLWQVESHSRGGPSLDMPCDVSDRRIFRFCASHVGRCGRNDCRIEEITAAIPITEMTESTGKHHRWNSSNGKPNYANQS